MAGTIVVRMDAQGKYVIPGLERSHVAKVDVVDVDIVIETKEGGHYLLPGAGLAAMSDMPAPIVFTDQNIGADQLLAQVGTSLTVGAEVQTMTSEEVKKEVEQAVKEAVKEAKAAMEKQHEDEKKHEQDQTKSHDQDHDKVSAVAVNTEATVEQMVEKAQKITENLHTTNYDFVPAHEYQPPPNAVASPPGVTPPISLTPITTLFVGNVVGTVYDTTSIPGVTVIYGSGGADGSDANSQIGPRNALQFSTATIAGTSGDDIIYAEGAVGGNGSNLTTLYEKQFNLNIAGYFTTLNNVIISGVPAGVSIAGGTYIGDGTWSLAASSVLQQQGFGLIYDATAPGSTGSFDITVDITGQALRGSNFHSVQAFRFQYLGVTDVGQVTDPTLVWEDHGYTKEIYILPTLDQPNYITADAGNDTIYGGHNANTIIGGNGNDNVTTYQGNDSITLGNGNNTISGGAGDNNILTGSGNDRILVADGANTIDSGSGDNRITVGNGGNHIAAGVGNDSVYGGSGSDYIAIGDGANLVSDTGGNNLVATGLGDDTITLGDGNNTVNGGDGLNMITIGTGLNFVVTGSGNDTITITAGGGTITAGDGINTISVGGGNYTLITGTGADSITAGNGNNSINAGDGNNHVTVGDGNNTIATGSGNDSLVGGNGTNIFGAGLGTNTITGGTGNNTLDYHTVTTTAITVSLLTGLATGTGLSDNFVNIANVTGNDLGDTITGNASVNILTGGLGNDLITGSGGNDLLYGGGGNDTLTGDIGNDRIYGGAGNNTIYGGASGADSLYGGSGNNSFLNPHAGIYYDGTGGANLVLGQFNTIDYSADSTAHIINLSTGTGIGGLANGSVYAFTPTSGANSINSIIAGSGNDTITGSASDDYLFGGAGAVTLNGGLGNNILQGGAGSGTDTYTMGNGHDTIIGSTSSYDRVQYQGSPSGIVINLDSVDHSFTNSLGNNVTIAAYSGGSFGATVADQSSYALGDYFTPVSASQTSIDEVNGTNFADLIFTGSNYTTYYNTSNGSDTVYGGSGGVLMYGNDTTDYFYGGAGNDTFAFSNGSDRADGGGGFNVIRTDGFTSSGMVSYNNTVYLDGTVDINGNGIADYIDRGVPSLTSGGVTYTGFEYGWNNSATGSVSFLFNNFENVYGSSKNDFVVGDGQANQFNTREGTNSIYGMGGNDIISAMEGSNAIDGGSGTDLVNFQQANTGVSGSLANVSVSYTYGVSVFLSDSNFLGGGSDKTSTWGTGLSVYQARTGTSGTYLYSTITGVENINGSDYNDILYGNNSANVIYGNNGVDTIAGNGGADSLYGGAGNDTFLATSAQLATVNIFDGGAGTDIVQAAGWTFAANSISNSRFNLIETVDVRNSASGGSYGLSYSDVQAFADNGTSSNITLKLDSGDTFTAAAGTGTALLVSHTATDDVYKFYSDAGHTSNNSVNLLATLTVHYGP